MQYNVIQTDGNGDVSSIADITTYNKKTTTTTTITTSSNSFKTDFSGEVKENTEDFVNLYKRCASRLRLEPDWLLELMENSGKTSNMVDLTKYLLYKATGDNYGVTDFSNLDLFEGISLNSENGSQSIVFSLFDIPDISKEEFIELVKAYQANSDYYNENLVKYAGEFYDICIEQGINPTYAFTYACIATIYGEDVVDYNLFKIMDDENNIKSYSSAKESILDFCNLSKNGKIKNISETEIENKALLIFKDNIYVVLDGNIELAFVYIALHENGYTYKYLTTNDFDDKYDAPGYGYESIKASVTKDKKYYKCKSDGLNSDNGTRNFGYGVLHYYDGRNPNLGSAGFGNQDKYSKVGVNIEQEKYKYTYDQNNESILEVEKVDKVCREIIKENRKALDKAAKAENIILNDDELNAMCYCMHCYGPGEASNFVSYYKRYGNTEALRQNYKFFSYFDDQGWRDQLWDAFHNGKYTDPITGKEIDKSLYLDGSSTSFNGNIAANGTKIAKSGDGYTAVYKSGDREYKLYEQFMGTYTFARYGRRTISDYGCGPSCVAIIASGYNPKINPLTVVNDCSDITERYGMGYLNSVSRLFTTLWF